MKWTNFVEIGCTGNCQNDNVLYSQEKNRQSDIPVSVFDGRFALNKLTGTLNHAKSGADGSVLVKI